MSNFKQLIGDWMLEELGSDSIDKYWSEKNVELGLDPFNIASGSHQKFWIKCQCASYHEDYSISAHNFKKGRRCPYCKCKKIHPYDSFAMWGIYNYGQSFLEDYWDYDKNNVDPWEIPIAGIKKVWIKCQSLEFSYHPSYLVSLNAFTTNNSRCSYCTRTGGKLHILDSLASKYPDSLLLWSDKNDKSPFEYASRTEQEVYWCCENGIHDDYLRRVDNSVLRNFRCPKCHGKFRHTQEGFVNMVKELVGDEYIVVSKYTCLRDKVIFKHNTSKCQHEFPMKASNFLHNGQRCPVCNESKGEKRIREWLDLNKFEFTPQMEFEGLLGLGGGNLSYDFYLPKQNILIEYQGEFHDGSSGEYSKLNLKKQQEHDRRKRKYTNDNGISLLEIWYWDFDNIEEILGNKLY